MLVFVHFVFFLGFTHSHPGLDINIVINAINICKCMVDDIMFHIPHETVPAEYIKGKCGEHIHPFVFAKTPMGAVMHNIESNRSNHTTQQNTFQYCPERIRCKENQVNINKSKSNHQNNSLHKNLEIARGGL